MLNNNDDHCNDATVTSTNGSLNLNCVTTINSSDQMTVCVARPATVVPSIDIYNIAKAKKVELPRLCATSLIKTTTTYVTATTPTTSIISTGTGTGTGTTNTCTNTSYTDTLLMEPKLSATTGPNATECQSTVIISFKSTSLSSSTTLLSSSSTTSSSSSSSSSSIMMPMGLPAKYTISTTSNECNTIPIETQEEYYPSPVLATNGMIKCATTQTSQDNGGADLYNNFVTPKNNVLNKIASFTLEKSAPTAISHHNGSHSTSTLYSSPYMDQLSTQFVPKKLDFTLYEIFEGQMLIKWLLSSLQNQNRHSMDIGEHDLVALTEQYCSNLMQVGALTQISDSNETGTFSPFQMYQWTHTKISNTCNAQSMAPRKLDKAWPYYSTPTMMCSVPCLADKAVQVGITTYEWSKTHQKYLLKQLLNCSTISEVHDLINDSTAFRKLQMTSWRSRDNLNALNDVGNYESESGGGDISDRYEGNLKHCATQINEINGNRRICERCFQTYLSTTNLRREKQIQVNLPIEKTIPKNNNQIPAVSPRPPPPPPPPPPSSLTFVHSMQSTSVPPPPPPPHSTSMPAINTVQSIPKPPPLPTKCDTTAKLSFSNRANPNASFPANVDVTSMEISATDNDKSTNVITPVPLPNPNESGWFRKTNFPYLDVRKMPINPPKPMKPLYWTRIISTPSLSKVKKCLYSKEDVTDGFRETEPKEIWAEIDETDLDNIDEFTELFSRQAVVPRKRPKEISTVRSKILKILDSERSRNVGIVSRSLHVDFCEIEHAIYYVDTSVVSLETLQQIINIKASNTELKLIREAAERNEPLDYPEQFLWKISQISMSTERISCIVFQADFEEATTQIERKLTVVGHLSHFLVESEELKLVFSIILTLGNYMNGGNHQRGQADGFTLEILSKLKDVKSNDTHTTLLHFIVRTYIHHKMKNGSLLRDVPLPVPEPADFERAVLVDFNEIRSQLTELTQKLTHHKNTTDKVILNSNEKILEPFKSRMTEFIESANKIISKLEKELNNGRVKFFEAMRFYHFTPKTDLIEQCTPGQFFEYWTNFANDFKDIWKKEIAILWNKMLKKPKQAQNEMRKNVKITKLEPGGLKERIMRINKKQTTTNSPASVSAPDSIKH